MTLTADEDQLVYLTAYTWEDRGIPEMCRKDSMKLNHAIQVSSLDAIYTWEYGVRALEPFKVRAGKSVKIEMEWNFTTQNIAKDWSLTAYGNGKPGSLHLTHD